ncbi:MAG: hypothetical protein M1814_003140 [Vezdaea aestivalis]|nr:MAG: hypothetical protein M1814_003140 [Vezdaea aestivalis]
MQLDRDGKTAYSILTLAPFSNPTLSELKAAYHAALLAHHPDKSSPTRPPPKFTVDDITHAYQTLLSPPARRDLDRSLRLHKSKAGSSGGEIVDLEDLLEEQGSRDGEARWRRLCRCGAEWGFVVEESMLEDAVRRGEREVLVLCEGCSLGLTVRFDVEDS